ncbi:hypothetical protein C7S13_4060 [Burkholderia cepacia]|nr:hypothetical protein [Burkholderia cepacia]
MVLTPSCSLVSSNPEEMAIVMHDEPVLVGKPRETHCERPLSIPS